MHAFGYQIGYNKIFAEICGISCRDVSMPFEGYSSRHTSCPCLHLSRTTLQPGTLQTVITCLFCINYRNTKLNGVLTTWKWSKNLSRLGINKLLWRNWSIFIVLGVHKDSTLFDMFSYLPINCSIRSFGACCIVSVLI